MTDILAIGAHPDDIELSCSGTIIKEISKGKTVVLADLTHGELGTRGNGPKRLEEARAAADIMGVKERVNLNMRDGFLADDEEHLKPIVQIIRKYQPKIILCNAVDDRHPDHGMAAQLVKKACFHAGLVKYETEYEGAVQDKWRPQAVYHYIQFKYLRPDFLVDVTEQYEQRTKAIKAYASQFYNPKSDEPESLISSEEFLDFIEARSREFGRIIGVRNAEGFNVQRLPQLDSLFDIK